ncbi:MAG TPA: MCE family protein [Mycobacteriales bacterium]|nr:MCE family protein [Mycobacteriales bacterium]
MKSSLAPLVKLVAFATVTVLATYVLATTISGGGFSSTTTYRARFTDVTGLVNGDDVRIAGVRVGRVTGIQVVRRTLAEITFTVRSDHRLPTSTLARIRYRNLVGQRYVALAQGPGQTDRMLPPNGEIPLDQTEPALDLTALFGGFTPLFQALDPGQVNRLAFEIVQVLQGESGTVDDLLAHLASLTTSLADRDAVIGKVIDNLNSVLGTVSQRDTELAGLISQLQRFVSGLAADRTAIGDSLGDIDALASATADLLDKSRPAIQTDIDQLGSLAKHLADSRKTVDGVLRRLPDKLNAITRTATYGSWFNFYLCSLDGRVALPGLPLTDNLPANLRVVVDEARCG